MGNPVLMLSFRCYITYELLLMSNLEQVSAPCGSVSVLAFAEDNISLVVLERGSNELAVGGSGLKIRVYCQSTERKNYRAS